MSDQFDRMTYSESRTINTGNYEKIDCFFSFSTSVTGINFVDKKMTIQHSDKVDLPHPSTSEEFKDAAKKVQSRVRAVLDNREKQIRVASFPYVEFRTLEKIGLEAPKKKNDDFLEED